MLANGFKINECVKCIYVKEVENGYVILCLYIDDMLVVGNNDKMVRFTKNILKFSFELKDMGLVDIILRKKSLGHQWT